MTPAALGFFGFGGGMGTSYHLQVVADDWTGIRKQSEKALPLNAETFVERLRLLSVRARDLRTLREAMRERSGK